MAAASIRNSQTADFTTSASFACTCPTVVADDLLLAWISANGGGTITPPAGWFRAPQSGGHTGRTHSGGTAWLYWKIADGTETGTITFSNSATRTGSMTIFSVQNVNPKIPFGFVRQSTGSDDETIPNMASIFDVGLGLWLFAYDSLVDETGATYTGGAAANWASAITKNNASTATGLVVGTNTANYATRTMSGAGTTTFNVAGGFCNSAWAAIIINSVDEAPATLEKVFSALSSTAGATSTTIFDPSTEYEGGLSFGRFLLPGITLVAVLGGKAAEAITLSNWRTQQGLVAFTQFTGSPYNHTEAADRLRMWAGHLVLTEEDCYSSTLETISGTFSSGIHNQVIYGGYALADPSNAQYNVGAFQTIDPQSTAPDPASFSVPENNSIAIVCAHGDANGSPTGPAGYTDVAKQTNASSTQWSYMGQKLVSAGTEDPGTLTTVNSRQILFTFSFFSSDVPPPTNTVAPAVTPTTDPDVDDVLATTDGTWTGSPTFTYQWQRSDNGVSGWSNIGDTDNSHTVVSGDLSKYIRCVITGTNASGSADANSNVVGPVGTALAVTSPTFPSPNTGSYFDQASTVATGGTEPYTYTVQSGSLPSGLSLSATTGRITGVPNGAAGASTFVIRVTDAQSQIEDTGTLSITVVVPAVAIDTPRAVDGRVGRAYDYQLRASGGTGGFVFTVTDGALPTGLSLSSGGRITGTPTVPGAFRVKIRATDSAANFKEQWF